MTRSITITTRWGRNSWKCDPNNWEYIGGGRTHICHVATPENNLEGKTFNLAGKSYVCRAGKGFALCIHVEGIKDRSGKQAHVTIAWYLKKEDAIELKRNLGW